VGESLPAALMGGDNGEAGAGGQPPQRLFPRLLRGLWGDMNPGLPGRKNQLFSSDLIRLSNSSNEVSPLIFSPLMKKVGVESTFSTSLAYF
jgi:hypothetical protein